MAEKWKFVEIPDVKPIYKVSDKGRIMNNTTGKILTLTPDKGGYLTIGFACFSRKQKRFTVHRIVALMFIPNPDPKNKTTVNHKDGDKTNNCVENLEWLSNSDNVKDMYAKGRHPTKKGEDVPNSKYTNEQIHTICKMLEMGYSNKQISIATNVPKNIIGFIKKRALWTHISCYYEFDGPKEKEKYRKWFAKFDKFIFEGYEWKDVKEYYGISGKDTKPLRQLYQRRQKKIISQSSTTIQTEP